MSIPERRRESTLPSTRTLDSLLQLEVLHKTSNEEHCLAPQGSAVGNRKSPDMTTSVDNCLQGARCLPSLPEFSATSPRVDSALVAGVHIVKTDP